MSAVQEPGPERAQGDRRRPNLLLVLIDRWAQLAAERPWRYVAIWAIGIGAANLGLRLLLNDRSLARNAPLAVLTAVGFWAFAWMYTAQLTRSFRGQRPRPAANPAIPKPKQGCATGWRAGSPGRRPSSGRSARSQWLWLCPRPVKAPVRRLGRPPGQSRSRRRRLALAAVAAAITLALLVGAITSRRAAPGGGHDVVVPSWGN
jgi:hypothetical protein